MTASGVAATALRIVHAVRGASSGLPTVCWPGLSPLPSQCVNRALVAGETDMRVLTSHLEPSLGIVSDQEAGHTFVRLGEL
eukprot:CAMPEP_0202049456 /NCGR_PEP_ID=MMETSP0963-20130614/3387_1 /ASSEMBLY_ACC=CAM_ASM_000494 /TAXON_ID=4773 /ORGANISM="Schizochytrium aggregatum, Strain ATCC28209" /LENGTH=80 /DNA_ID=CAMNT_0048614465 /DNA_START=109 /DNA_END=348 /DNA_ORIENTATION=-